MDGDEGGGERDVLRIGGTSAMTIDSSGGTMSLVTSFEEAEDSQFFFLLFIVVELSSDF